MEAGEFEDWKRLHRAEPWGAPVEDERLRILLSGMANIHCEKKTVPSDFAFTWGEAEKRERVLLDFRTGMKLLADSHRPRR